MTKKFKFVKTLTIISIAAVTSISCCGLFGSYFNSTYAVNLKEFAFKGYYEDYSSFDSIFNDKLTDTNKNRIYESDFNKLNSAINSNGDKNLITIWKDPAEIKALKRQFAVFPMNDVDVEDSYINGRSCLKVNSFKQRFDHGNFSKVKLGEFYGIKYDNLKKGDIIVSVNDKRIDGLSNYELNEVIEELKTNQNLEIDFLRPTTSPKNNNNCFINDDDIDDETDNFDCLKYECTMDIDALWKKLPSFIRCKNLQDKSNKNGIIYTKLKEISYDAFALLTKQLRIIDKSKTKSLIIDLTDCSGGSFGAAKKMAGLFFPRDKKYITLKNLNGDAFPLTLKNHEIPLVETESSNTGNPQTNSIKLKVIVNEKTTDAAEQLASILKTCANAEIYGKKPKIEQIERKGFSIYNSKGEKISYAMFPKTAYKAGAMDDFYEVNPVDVDFECDINEEQIVNIVNSIVLEKPLQNSFSEEELKNIDKKDILRVILSKNRKSDLRTKEYVVKKCAEQYEKDRGNCINELNIDSIENIKEYCFKKGEFEECEIKNFDGLLKIFLLLFPLLENFFKDEFSVKIHGKYRTAKQVFKEEFKLYKDIFKNYSKDEFLNLCNFRRYLEKNKFNRNYLDLSEPHPFYFFISLLYNKIRELQNAKNEEAKSKNEEAKSKNEEAKSKNEEAKSTFNEKEESDLKLDWNDEDFENLKNALKKQSDDANKKAREAKEAREASGNKK